MRRVLLLVVVLLAGLFLFTLPPRPRPTRPGPASPSPPAATARGAYHIHTTRSDGTGTIDEVAAAAARAGLRFIVLTDHGDATRTPLAPAYRGGVLVIDAVEISTTGGHYAALDLPGAAPYRLAGEPRDVVEDVRRLGGFGIAAHPTSGKPALRWSGWDTPFDGIEWLNVDTEWRDESRPALLLSLLRYPVRAAETVAALFSHEREAIDHWDARAARRRVVGIAAVDAHARIGLSERQDPYAGLGVLRVPSYEALFQTFTLRVELPRALTGDAIDDARAVMAALREGHVYTVLDALAGPGAIRFEAVSGERPARMGEFLPPAGAVVWRASADAPDRGAGWGGGGAGRATMRLVCDGRVVAEAPASTLLKYQHAAGAALPGACRVEVGWDAGGRRVLWLVTNPIYLRGDDPPIGPPALPRARESWALPIASAADWTIEQDGRSRGSVTWEPAPDGAAAPGSGTQAPAARLDFTLRDGLREAQFVALVTTRIDGLPRATRVRFRASAARPMRLSVQVRNPAGAGQRWRRSIYLDETPREYVVTWDEMSPTAAGQAPHPPLAHVHALLFVVDTVNTLPGRAGSVRVGGLRLER